MKTLDLIQAIFACRSLASLRALIAIAAASPAASITEHEKSINSKKGLRTFFFILQLIAICVVTYFAFIGGSFISDVAGPIAIVFAALDMVVAFVIFKDIIKKYKFAFILFQVVSLAYIGYAATGYFNSGNVQSVAQARAQVIYQVASKFYGAYTNTVSAHKSAMNTAGVVAKGELAADGVKGAVYGQALALATSPIDSVSAPVQIVLSDNLKSLGEANIALTDYIAKTETKINDISGKGLAIIAFDSTQAISFTTTKAAITGDRRIANMEMLIGALNSVVSSKVALHNVPTIENQKLSSADLEGDTFQSIIGFLIDIIIIVLSIVVSQLGFTEVSGAELDIMKIDQILLEQIKLAHKTGLQINNTAPLSINQLTILQEIADDATSIGILKENKITKAATLFEFIEDGFTVSDIPKCIVVKEILKKFETKILLSDLKHFIRNANVEILDFLNTRVTNSDILQSLKTATLEEVQMVVEFLNSKTCKGSSVLRNTFINGFLGKADGWFSLVTLAEGWKGVVESAQPSDTESLIAMREKEVIVKFVNPAKPAKEVTMTELIAAFTVDND